MRIDYRTPTLTFIGGREGGVRSAGGLICPNCVGKDDIEPAPLFFDLFEQTIQIAELRHISLHARDIGPQLLYRLIQFRLPPAADKHVGALLHEAFRRREANAAVTARDRCNFPSGLPMKFSSGYVAHRWVGPWIRPRHDQNCSLRS